MATTVKGINWENEVRLGNLPARVSDVFMGESLPYQKPSETILGILRRLLTGILAGHKTIKEYILKLIAEPYPEDIYQISEQERKLIVLWWKDFNVIHLRNLRGDIYKEKSGLTTFGEFMTR